MGHDIHFLERLERVSPEHQALALRLYRDPKLTRRIAEAVCRSEGLDGAKERIALALEDGGQGPHIIITREGRFVTCLGRGMVLGPMPILSRAMLDANSEWRQQIKLLKDDGVGLMALLTHDILKDDHWPSSAQIEQLEVFGGFFVPDLYDNILEAYKTLELIREKALTANRRARQRMFGGREGADILVGWAAQRRYLMHALIMFVAGIFSGDPLWRKGYEREALAPNATLLFLMFTPAAALRGAWIMAQRQHIGAVALFEELVAALKHRQTLHLYLLAMLGVLLGLEEEREAMLLVMEKFEELVDEAGTPRTELAQAVLEALHRTRWCWEHRELALHERARLMAQQESCKIPPWAERFYDPELLERDPQGMVEELLRAEQPMFEGFREYALLWLYLPEIAHKSAAQLYPVTSPEPLKGRARRERDEAILDALIQRYHRFEVHTAAPESKQGRNDPCACGSGKKYKKCCAQQEA